MVISSDARYGPFNVNSRTIELSDADTMTVGTPIDSWLDTTEREITLTIEEAAYQIEMRADEFEYLELEGPNDYYREDDDSAGELNARIADFLAPGTYQLTARTAYGTDSGLFTLAIEPRDLPNDVELRNEGALTPDETLNGWYSGEALTYQLTIEESSLVTLSMSSNDFDTYLELYGEGVSTDDDSGGGTNARLEQALLPGTYTVSARGFSASGSGMFELAVSAEPTEMQPDT